ncbi:ParB/RepB/Spo0J family partition protein [Specibacter sp. NPDC078692]|uniref:ParB/RepB/Spo0J family partition protein n=1 Tax=Specibacter sp. NPDC078692 TaxID=3155818 RepID=UPI00341D1A84
MSELIEVSVAKLEAHPNNIRKEIARDAAFDDLVAGIKAVGLIHPPVVIPHPTAKTKYRIVTGHRRHAAAQVAGLKKISVDLHMDLSEQQQRDMQYQENKHRVGNTVMERAQYVANELDLGGRTIADLAKGMGVTQDQVRTSKKLSSAPGKMHTKINDGQMTLEDALILAEFNGDVEAQDELLQAWNTWSWATTLRRWRNLRQAQKQAPKTKRELTVAGATIAASRDEVGEHRWAQDGLSTEEHVAAGHVAVINETETGQATWFELVVESEEPEKTPEERQAQAAAEKAAEDLKAELVLAGQVREEALKALIKTPPAGLAWTLTMAAVARRVVIAKAWDWAGVPSKSSPEEVEAAFAKWTLEQLLMLDDVIQKTDEQRLVESLAGWGPSRWGSDYGMGWRDRLSEVYGYQWSDLERGFMKQQEDLVNGSCQECDEPLDSDQREGKLCTDCLGDLCSQCQGDLDDGEGYDGKCGDCADRAEEIANDDDVEVAQ